jgi:hypothetical protein
MIFAHTAFGKCFMHTDFIQNRAQLALPQLDVFVAENPNTCVRANASKSARFPMPPVAAPGQASRRRCGRRSFAGHSQGTRSTHGTRRVPAVLTVLAGTSCTGRAWCARSRSGTRRTTTAARHVYCRVLQSTQAVLQSTREYCREIWRNVEYSSPLSGTLGCPRVLYSIIEERIGALVVIYGTSSSTRGTRGALGRALECGCGQVREAKDAAHIKKWE